jgi:hypothetical protein
MATTPIDDYANRKKAAQKRMSGYRSDDEAKQADYDHKKQQHGQKSFIGKAVGGVAGAYFGGPKGAVQGAQMGGALVGGAPPEKPTKEGEAKPAKKKDDKGDALTKGLDAFGKMGKDKDKAEKAEKDKLTDGGKHPAPAGYENESSDLDFGAVANLIRAAYQAKS